MNRFVLCSLLLILPSQAWATQCPGLWQQVTTKMQGVHGATLDRAKLEELRKKAEESHHAGNHPEAEAALKQALALFN
jgi:hypothetical protein